MGAASPLGEANGVAPPPCRLELLSFRIGETAFGLELRTIREVVRPPATARVPGAPPFVRGITHLRGEVLAVVDGGRRLGLPASPSPAERVVVIAHPDGPFGLHVDAVGGVLRVEDPGPAELPAGIEGLDEGVVRGIIRHDAGPIVLLDSEALLTEVAVPQSAGRGGPAPPRAGGGSEAPEEPRGTPRLQVVAIRVGAEPWALPIQRVREITRMPELTRLPAQSPSLCGMAVLRGEVLPVVDLRLALGMPPLATEAESLAEALEAAATAHTPGEATRPDGCPLAAVLAHPALPVLVEPDLRERLVRIEAEYHRASPEGKPSAPAVSAGGTRSRDALSGLLSAARRACVELGGRRCVVVEAGVGPVGLAVDAVEEVRSLSAEDLIPGDELDADRFHQAPLFALARPTGERPPLPVLDVDALVHDAPSRATPVATGAAPEESMDQPRHLHPRRQLVVFQLGEEEFAADIQHVQEIVRLEATTRVPHAPPGVEGVMNLRGEVLPVLDLRRRFGLAPRPHDESTRVVVARVGRERAGLIVDGVSEVLRIPASEIRAAPPLLSGPADPDLVEGVAVLDEGRRTILLVTVEALLLEAVPPDGKPSSPIPTQPEA